MLMLGDIEKFSSRDVEMVDRSLVFTELILRRHCLKIIESIAH